MENQGIIYKATCIITNQSYVGKTTKTKEERWEYHCYISSYKTDNYYIHNAIRKHGSENFMVEHLCDCETYEIMNIMETFMIMVHYTHWTEGGYNMTWGGDGGDFITGHPDYEKIRQNNSDKAKRLWSDPVYYQKQCEIIKKSLSKPGVRDRAAESLHSRYIDPGDGLKQKMSNITKLQFENPEAHIKVSKGHKRSWKDPKVRKRYVNAAKKKSEDPEKIQNFRKAVKGAHWYYNEISQITTLFLPEENIPEGWIKGRGPKGKTKSLYWYHNGNLRKRFISNSNIPEGWIKGMGKTKNNT